MLFRSLALAGCASTSGSTKASSEPLPDEEGKMPTERETISKAGAEQIIPKEKKRNISADQRADFEKAMKRYQEAKKGDGKKGDKGDAKNALSVCLDGIKKTAPTRFELRKKDFVPERDLAVLIVTSRDRTPGQSPSK